MGSTRHGRKLFDNLRKEREHLIAQGIQPSTKALSESLSIPEDEIIVFSQHFSSPALSLDSPVNADDQRTLEETVASQKTDTPETLVSNLEFGSILREHLGEFAKNLTDERELKIWKERLMADSDDKKSLQELGEKFGVSKERIRQVESRMKNRLRLYLQERLGDEIDFDFS